MAKAKSKAKHIAASSTMVIGNERLPTMRNKTIRSRPIRMFKVLPWLQKSSA